MFKKAINVLMIERDVSPSQLSSKSGMSKSQIQNLKESENPTIYSLIKLAKGLGVKLSTLILKMEELK